MVPTAIGNVPVDSPWLSNPELSPGTGFFQWQHVPPGDYPISMQEEFLYMSTQPRI